MGKGGKSRHEKPCQEIPDIFPMGVNQDCPRPAHVKTVHSGLNIKAEDDREHISNLGEKLWKLVPDVSDVSW